jgi:hypothetical protein
MVQVLCRIVECARSTSRDKHGQSPLGLVIGYLMIIHVELDDGAWYSNNPTAVT